MHKIITDSNRTMYIALLAIVAVLIILSFMLGNSISGVVFGLASGDPQTDYLIFREIRLPRTLLLVLCGASLGMAGAVLQGLFRNPLAEPGIIGTSASASLGAVLLIYFGSGFNHPFLVSLAGIVGAYISLTVLYQLIRRNHSMTTIILTGVAINSLSAALIALSLNLAPDPFAATEIMTWLMGSVTDRELGLVFWLLPFVIFGILLMLLSSKALDALTLGNDTATSLGFNIKRTSLFAVSGAGIAVGACTSITGAIGFIGLIVPHILRQFVQHKPGKLLLPSALGGVALLTASDMMVRLLPAGPELKLGVITALLGVPFFLYIIINYRYGTS